MKVELFTEVALAYDVPAMGLCRGDIATVVEYLPAPDDETEEGYALEVFNAVGESIKVVAVPHSAVEALRSSEVLSVRHLTPVR